MSSNECYIIWGALWSLLAVAPASAQGVGQAKAGHDREERGPARVGQAVADPVRIPRVARPPVLEDYLSGAPSQGELALDGFRQRDPNDGDAASQPTTAYLSFDAEHLYLAFVCLDRDPSRIRARLSRRDATTQDDLVTVMLDTFHDRQRSYLFAVNALGIQSDALASEGREDDYSFDTVWRSDGRLTSAGFVVLMAIPFKSLRISADPTGTWGLALSRTIPRNSEQSFWPYVTRRVEGVTQQFATFARPERVSGGRNIQLIPYAAVSRGRYLDAATSGFTTPTDRRLGLDAKIVVRDAAALDITVYPDFSQVESDQPQVAINQRFELFYPEKRPFFLENAATFKYVRTATTDPTTRLIPEMLFFSRRIQNPAFGARVTGKSGPWSFGAILANDRGLGAVAAANVDATVAVGRLQREFRNQSTIGVLATSHQRGIETNRVGALDVRWKLSPNWVAALQAVASRSEQADGSRQGGPAYNASLFYNSRNVLYSAFYSERSPTFRSVLGFVPRTDIRQIEQYAEYRVRPRSGPVVAFGPNSYFRLNWNHAGQLQEWIVRFPFEVHLKGRTQVFVRRVESYELFDGVDLRGHIQTINVTTEWLKWLAINEGFEWGVAPNYFPPRGMRPYVGDSVTATVGLTFRPTPRVRAELTYLHSGLEGGPPGASGRPKVFSNHIVRATLNYQFTRQLSVRAIADYNSVSPNAALVRLVNDRRVGIDTLITYQLGPGTALYAGYTSGFQNVRPSLLGSPVERTTTPGQQVGHQLFLKISYQFRL